MSINVTLAEYEIITFKTTSCRNENYLELINSYFILHFKTTYVMLIYN